MKQTDSTGCFRVGVDYYPEHWPEERWETDAKLMQKAGFNVVRMAEFAWARMEPVEGRYSFDWLDRAIAILGRHGIDVVLGIEIPEYESIAADYPLTGEGALAGEFTATGFADWIVPGTAEVLARHGAAHAKEYAAATVNAFGKGVAYHVGAVVKEEAFYRLLLQDVCRRAGVRTGVEPPDGVEAVVREAAGRRLLFLVNHTERPAAVEVPAGRPCLLGGGKTGGQIELPPFGVEVVRL